MASAVELAEGNEFVEMRRVTSDANQNAGANATDELNVGSPREKLARVSAEEGDAENMGTGRPDTERAANSEPYRKEDLRTGVSRRKSDAHEAVPMNVDSSANGVSRADITLEGVAMGVEMQEGASGADLTHQLEMLARVQPPAVVRRIAVRSVLWEDILVEVPSTATMAEFRKAIESQSGGKLREDMLPELVYDGILLPADDTSLEEAGLTAENAVVGFLAMNVSALTSSASLDVESAREKKSRDRRIKIYVPCAPQAPGEAAVLVDMTPPANRKTAPPTEAVDRDMNDRQPEPTGTSELSLLPNRSQEPPPTSIPNVAENAPNGLGQPVANPAASGSLAPANPPPQTQTPPGADTVLADTTAMPSNPPVDSSDAPQNETPVREARDLLAGPPPPISLAVSEPSGPRPSDEAGPSKLSPGKFDACTQIEPGEFLCPLAVLAVLPPHLLQLSLGGDPEPPKEETALAGDQDKASVDPPPETSAVAADGASRPIVEHPSNSEPAAGDGGTDEGGLQVALIPPPYLPPPPVVYGPGGREMVPVDGTRKRKQRTAPETEEERQVRLRRARKLFTVGEVEALVTAVERLGPGRWREVKERVFSHADHRTYGDLKDKWKTLVKTAQIAPQQRRGVELPEELLERVTRAHAFWAAQAAKNDRVRDADRGPNPHQVRTPEANKRPNAFGNGTFPAVRAHPVGPAPQGAELAGEGPPQDGQETQGREAAEAAAGAAATGQPDHGSYSDHDAEEVHPQPAEPSHISANPGPTQAVNTPEGDPARVVHPPDGAQMHEQYVGQSQPYVDESTAQQWHPQMHYYQGQQPQGYPPQYAYETAQHPSAKYQPGQGFMQPVDPGHLAERGPSGYQQPGTEGDYRAEEGAGYEQDEDRGEEDEGEFQDAGDGTDYPVGGGDVYQAHQPPSAQQEYVLQQAATMSEFLMGERVGGQHYGPRHSADEAGG